MLHSGRFGKQSRKSECFGPGKHPAPLSPPFTPLLQDHACMRDEAVHRDTRPELRPTSHQSRSLDCKIREHIGTITSASLVRGSHPVGIEKSARVSALVRVVACVCRSVCVRVRSDGGDGGDGGGVHEEGEGRGVCVLSCTSVVMATRSC